MPNPLALFSGLIPSLTVIAIVDVAIITLRKVIASITNSILVIQCVILGIGSIFCANRFGGCFTFGTRMKQNQTYQDSKPYFFLIEHQFDPASIFSYTLVSLLPNLFDSLVSCCTCIGYECNRTQKFCIRVDNPIGIHLGNSDCCSLVRVAAYCSPYGLS